MAILKECMHCVNTPFHSQILHLFQFADEMPNSHIYLTNKETAKDECVMTFLDNFLFSGCHPLDYL